MNTLHVHYYSRIHKRIRKKISNENIKNYIY